MEDDAAVAELAGMRESVGGLILAVNPQSDLLTAASESAAVAEGPFMMVMAARGTVPGVTGAIIDVDDVSTAGDTDTEMELRGAAAAAAAGGVADDEDNEDAGPGVVGDWTCTSVAVDTGSVTREAAGA